MAYRSAVIAFSKTELCPFNASGVKLVRSFSSSASDKNKNVAFIGLGNMGNHMATNLAKKGFLVTGYDKIESAIKEVVKNGVCEGKSAADAASNAEFVITALPNNDIVLDTYLGTGGVVENAQSGALLIDTSTVDPAVSKEVAAAAHKKGLAFLDAPVSGGVMGAKNATLSFLIGGKDSDLQRALPLFQAMGANQIHCGDTGAGEVAKICNNMVMAVNVMAASEMMNMAIRMGLDPAVFHKVLNTSTGRSWVTEVYCPVPGIIPTAPSSHGYDTGFKTDLMVKDLHLGTSVAVASRSPAPLGALVQQLYRVAQLNGYGHKDFSVIYQFIKGQDESK